MKLKIYRSLLLTGLFLTLLLTITLLVLGFLNLLKDATDIGKNLLYIFCFILLIAFNILEIVNTFISFKTGSTFVYRLAFNDSKTVNKNFLFVISFLGLFSLAVSIYMTLTLFNPFLPLGGSPKLIVYLMICFFFFFFVDILFIILFVFLGKEDKAFKNK